MQGRAEHQNNSSNALVSASFEAKTRAFQLHTPLTVRIVVVVLGWFVLLQNQARSIQSKCQPCLGMYVARLWNLHLAVACVLGTRFMIRRLGVGDEGGKRDGMHAVTVNGIPSTL